MRVEELNALAAVIVEVEHARPLAEEQAQVERPRVEHQPGVAAQVLMGKFADLLVHCVFVAADAFGFADALRGGDNRPYVVVQTHGIVTDARGG